MSNPLSALVQFVRSSAIVAYTVTIVVLLVILYYIGTKTEIGKKVVKHTKEASQSASKTAQKVTKK